MTNEEIDALADAHGYLVADVGYEFTAQQFRDAVHEALKREREACANIAISWSDKSYEAEYIADEIRARSAD